jgi:hypothetical protein
VGIYGTGDEGEEVTVDLIEKTVQSVKAKVKDGR